MSILSGTNEFFGLDIGTSAIRLVQLAGGTNAKSLVRYAYAPVDSKIVLSDSKADQVKLQQEIKNLLTQSKVSVKNVAVGLPSQRVFTTTANFDRLNASELAKTIRLEAEALIPTPFAESKVDWAMVGDAPDDKTKVEVLLSSVANEYVESRLDMLESIGLNVIAFEPDSMAVARAVLPADVSNAHMVIDMGAKSTDIIIVMNGAPRLVRSVPTGVDAIIKSAMQNLNIDDKQADQFVFKFGLSKEKLEGQIYQAIISTVDSLVNEIEKSIKFFVARYNGSPVEKIVVTGGASALPEFPLYLANKFAVNVEIGNAWRNVSFPPARQNELLAISNHFGVAVGLAGRAE